MDRAEAVREMTFEEEAVLYQKEAKVIFAKEDTSCEAPSINHTVRRGMRIIRKAREEITTLREQEPKWINVKERLPSNEDVVLCVTKNNRPFVCRYDQYWKRWRVSGNVKVTHWMPLPKPPEEGTV